MRTAWFAVAALTVCSYGQELGRIEGRVVSSTGEPVSKAYVQFLIGQSATSFPRHYIEITGADGSYVSPGLPPGKYEALYSKEGYTRTGNRIWVEVQPGQVIRGFTLTLHPLGTISGRVTDADGDPIRGATLTLHRGSSGASNRGVSSNSQSTDDRGFFRFYNVDPGVYYLSARTHSAWIVRNAPPDSVIGANAQQVPLQTYYPSEASVAMARPIAVGVGEHVTGIDVRLRQGRVFAIRGRVEQESAEAVDLSIHVADIGDPAQSLGSYSVRADGRFSIPGLAPGTYALRAPDPWSSGHVVSGSVRVTVGNSDVEDVVVPLLPNIDVAGRIVVEGEDDTEFDSPTVAYADEVRSGFVQAPAAADGSFVLKNLRRDRYWLAAGTGETGLYVKALRSVGMEFREGVLDLAAGPPSGPVEIVLARGAGRVTGASPEPFSTGATPVILLWPKSPLLFHRDQGIRDTVAQEDTFGFNDVPPGEYSLAAFEQTPLYFRDGYRFLSQFNNAATAITIEPGATVTAEPKRIPRDAVAGAIANLP